MFTAFSEETEKAADCCQAETFVCFTNMTQKTRDLT